MKRRISIILLALLMTIGSVAAEGLQPRDGWRVTVTDMTYQSLLDGLIAAVPDEGMGVVTQAGPTGAARARGIEIPQNRVVGVFNNKYAVEILGLSTAAMIEAPIRFYVTEDPMDGTATLSWKTPSFIFAPYANEGGARLAQLAEELDLRFEAIAARATTEQAD